MASSNELVITGRIALRLGQRAGDGRNVYTGPTAEDRKMADEIEVAENLVRKIKRDSPQLWQRLRDTEITDRQIGDVLYDLAEEWEGLGKIGKDGIRRAPVAFRNYLAEICENDREFNEIVKRAKKTEVSRSR